VVVVVATTAGAVVDGVVGRTGGVLGCDADVSWLPEQPASRPIEPRTTNAAEVG
jgi:hypothetical protein